LIRWGDRPRDKAGPCASRQGPQQTLKNNRILLENYYLPGDLEQQIDAFVEHYNHVRYHESLNNLTPADVYFGRAETILVERERIKRATIANRRLQHQLLAA
jgi:putative transposase